MTNNSVLNILVNVSKIFRFKKRHFYKNVCTIISMGVYYSRAILTYFSAYAFIHRQSCPVNDKIIKRVLHICIVSLSLQT